MNPTPTNIPTPKSDAHIGSLNTEGICTIDVKFVRTLERENVTLTQQRDELKEEVERLKKEFASHWTDDGLAMVERSASIHQQNELFKKTIRELREVIEAIFDPSTGCEDVDRVYNYLKGWSFRRDSKIAIDLKEALSSTPSEISKKWVKREVLEKLEAACTDTLCDHEGNTCFTGSPMDRQIVHEALTLARTELGKGEK